MVREVGIHDNDKVSCCELQTVYVGSPKTEFPSAGADLDTLRGVDFLELSSDFLSAIRRAIVDNNEFPLEVTVKCLFSIEGRARWLQGWTNCSVKVLFSSHVIIGRLRRSL